MGLNFWKKHKKQTSSIIPNNQVEEKVQVSETTLKKHVSEKKQLLPDGALTREELLKEIEKQFAKQSGTPDNPFKTREDIYYCFYNSNMELSRPPVPFEEVKIGGKSFFVHKKFENGRVIIEELFGSPDIEINLKEEYDKKETTKAQLEKINKYILTIKKKIAQGHEEYSLLDIEDLKEEKWRLEKILESIKYGKTAIFKFQNPINQKPSYMLRYANGEYNYLKVTENNFVTEENNIKFLKGYEIQKRLEEITNMRITKNWKEIAIAILVIFVVVGLLFGLYKLMTFEEELFDKRVQTYCKDNLDFYKEQLFQIKDLKCELPSGTLNQPDYKQPK